MLSAESAAGKYPVEAVGMMNRIIEGTESDAMYRQLIEASHAAAESDAHDVTQAICCAMRRASAVLHAKAIVCYTSSGHTSFRAARERPDAPILSLSPQLSVSRKLAMAWGVHTVHVENPQDLRQLATMATEVARDQGFVETGNPVVIMAGVPFGESGTTNILRIAIA